MCRLRVPLSKSLIPQIEHSNFCFAVLFFLNLGSCTLCFLKWFFILYVSTDLSQILHFWVSLIGLCLSRCNLKVFFHPVLNEHISHSYLIFSWTRLLCTVTWPIACPWKSQSGHLCLLFKCTESIWVFRVDLLFKMTSQSSHLKVKLLCTVILCLLRFAKNVPAYWQWSHWNFCPTWIALVCLSKLSLYLAL